MNENLQPKEWIEATDGLPSLLRFDSDPHSCVYLPHKTACMPLLAPLEPLEGVQFDRLLESGHRRSGPFLYYTQCIDCQACKPTRLWVKDFVLTKSLRRVISKNHKCIETQIKPPVVSQTRIELFQRHRDERNLSRESSQFTVSEYRQFLVDSCCQALELSFWYKHQLVGCSIMDVGTSSCSAVYTFFDPDYSHLSLGTYAVLKQIQFAKETNRDLLYLGMYVSENPHLNYKARFKPQERLLDGVWTLIESEPTD